MADEAAETAAGGTICDNDEDDEDDGSIAFNVSAPSKPTAEICKVLSILTKHFNGNKRGSSSSSAESKGSTGVTSVVEVEAARLPGDKANSNRAGNTNTSTANHISENVSQ